MKTVALTVAALALSASAYAQTRDAGPMSPCTLTPAQIEEGRRVALQFPRDAVAIADSTYKQHNPAFVKGAREAGLSDFDYFKSRFGGPRAGGPPPQAGPTPPPGNNTEVVLTECDITTIMHRQLRQDPTAAPGTWYEAFTFDMFRVRNGKLVEHWDGAVITPPAPAGQGAPGGAPAGGRGN